MKRSGLLAACVLALAIYGILACLILDRFLTFYTGR